MRCAGLTVVLLGELFGERLAEGEEVGHGILDDLGACGTAEEEARLWVLDGLGGLLLEGALGASIPWFSVEEKESEGRVRARAA